MRISKDTIQARVLKALALLLFAVIALSGVSLYAILTAQTSSKSTHEAVKRFSSQFRDMHVALEQAVTSYEAAKGVTGAQPAEGFRRAKASFMSVHETMMSENAGGEWAPALTELKEKFDELEVLGREMSVAISESKADMASAKLEQMTSKAKSMRQYMDETSDKIAGQYESTLAQTLQFFMILLVPLMLLAIVVPSGYFWMTTQRLNRELSEYVNSLYTFSEQNDQTSESLKGASENLSSASSEQSAAVQQTVASIAEIRSMLAQTANHVREVQNMTATVNDKTHDGNQIMNRLESSMIAIEQANMQLQSFEDIIRSIKEKTQIINDIVFKTQLLSFNASIEAARAGQYGRGFAVVAEEVGKLAQMSGGASKEIDQLLVDSQRRVSQIVEAVQERVRDGKTVSGDALKRFNEIAKQISAISEKVNQVGEATLEQEGGVEQTARAMDQMDETALHNKKGAEHMFKIAEKVRQLSFKIREVTEGVSRYVRDNGRAHPGAEAPRRSVPAKEARASAPVATSMSSSSFGDENMLALVKNIAQKSAGNPTTTAANRLEDVAGMSADDPSFRKTGTKG